MIRIVNCAWPTVFLFSLAITGCLVRDSCKAKKPVAGPQTLEQIAFHSFQQRDIVRAKKLREMKGTKYDAKRQQAIESAGADASRETWKPVADELARRLNKIPQNDQAAFDSVIDELVRAAERAGK